MIIDSKAFLDFPAAIGATKAFARQNCCGSPARLGWMSPCPGTRSITVFSRGCTAWSNWDQPFFPVAYWLMAESRLVYSPRLVSDRGYHSTSIITAGTRNRGLKKISGHIPLIPTGVTFCLVRASLIRWPLLAFCSAALLTHFFARKFMLGKSLKDKILCLISSIPSRCLSQFLAKPVVILAGHLPLNTI